jgi:hypothetical protein
MPVWVGLVFVFGMAEGAEDGCAVGVFPVVYKEVFMAGCAVNKFGFG